MRKVASTLFTISEYLCAFIYSNYIFVIPFAKIIREENEWTKCKALERFRYGLEEVAGKREEKLGFGAKR